MSLWEYKVITSGKGGFATPAMMEKFLNDLGRDEWEIVCFQTAPENFLAFTGLARRSTQRDWTLEDAAAAAAKAEAEKLRAEFEAKFKAAASTAAAGGGEERAPSFLEEKAAPDDGFRKPIDTSRDDEPEAAEEEKDEWDELGQEDELPTFFEAIKPHMRRNQRGPGMSVGVDYLAKKWDQSEDDIKGALLECGFAMPEDEDTKPEYVEYDGDLYWLNINRRGELWINTKEKPRPVFRSVKATRIAMEEEAPKPAQQAAAGGEKSEVQTPKSEGAEGEGGTTVEAKPEGELAPETAAQPAAGDRNANGGGGSRLPLGPDLLRKIRPHMRRNRRGPGGSGSTNFLARALRVKEEELKTAFTGMGLAMPSSANDKPVYAEFGNELWWLNMDSRGGLWINGREKRQGEVVGGPAAASETTGEQAGETPALPGETVPGSAAVDAVPAPEVVPSTGGLPTEQPAAASESLPTATTEPASAAASEREREVAPMPAESAVVPQASEASAAGPATREAKSSGDVSAALAGVRSLLKETKTGGIAAKIDRIADETGKPAEDVLAMLTAAGLKVPEKPREKPVFVEQAGEIFWINKNARGELWLNAKASKFADKDKELADDESGADEDAGGGDGAAEGEAAEAGGTASEGGETETEKKPKRVRTRRKSE